MQKLTKLKLIKILNLYKIRLSITLFLITILIMGMQRYKAYTYLDNFILNLGFSLTKISITGIHKIDEYEIKEHIKYKKCRNLFCIDLEATKYALEQLDWVKNANLKLIFPSELKINIYEEEPKFILDNGNLAFLINSQGKKIEIIEDNKSLYQDLVVISGENVTDKINDLSNILNTSPDLAKNITSAKLISNRRWSLVYSYLTTLDLPENNPEQAFRKLALLNKRHGIISDNLKKIDLRVKDRMIIKFNINNFSFYESKV